MRVLALKFLNYGTRTLRMTNYNALRMSSSDNSCTNKPTDPCPQKPQQQEDPCVCAKTGEPPPKPEPCPPKQEPCSAKPDSLPKTPPAAKCNEPPPCAPMPKCPTAYCPQTVDRNNPCHYCPPVCIDPDYPDLKRLKKFQCLFQQDDDVPVYLKRGSIDAFVYQTVMIMVLIGTVVGVYNTVKLAMK